MLPGNVSTDWWCALGLSRQTNNKPQTRSTFARTWESIQGQDLERVKNEGKKQGSLGMWVLTFDNCLHAQGCFEACAIVQCSGVLERDSQYNIYKV